MAIDIDTAPEEQMTPEEVKERRQELTNFYKDGSKIDYFLEKYDNN